MTSNFIREDEDKNNKSLINEVLSNKFVHITNNPVVSQRYEIYLLENIGDIREYRSLFSLLRNLKKRDKVKILINNYGGSVHTGIDIINAMRASKAKLTTVVSGPLYSMAPLIALQGHKVILEPNTFMMFHDYSGMSGGKGSEVEAHVNHMRKFMLECFQQWTKGFLTKKEVEDTIGGRDLYLDFNQCKERLQKIGKLEA